MTSTRSIVCNDDESFFENLDHLAAISRATIHIMPTQEDNQEGEYSMELLDGNTKELLAKSVSNFKSKKGNEPS